MGTAVREETIGRVRRLTLCRPDEYNTITLSFRDELGAALDAAQRDREVSVVLLDAEGPAFCAGYGLDWSTSAQAGEESRDARAWDSVRDQHLIGSFAATWAKLHESSKPTVAAVQGWCIAGGTNVAFNAHLIVAAESARFGYPPSRVWGIPEAPWTWVARLGQQDGRDRVRVRATTSARVDGFRTRTRAGLAACRPARAAPYRSAGWPIVPQSACA